MNARCGGEQLEAEPAADTETVAVVTWRKQRAAGQRKQLDSSTMSAAPSLAPSAPPQMAATDDDPEATEAALRRLTPKSRIRLLPSVSKLRLKRRFRVQQPATTSEPDSLADHVGTPPRFSEETGSIVLDAQDLSDVPGDHNVYRWAILYENQRGYVSVHLQATALRTHYL